MARKAATARKPKQNKGQTKQETDNVVKSVEEIKIVQEQPMDTTVTTPKNEKNKKNKKLKTENNNENNNGTSTTTTTDNNTKTEANNNNKKKEKKKNKKKNKNNNNNKPKTETREKDLKKLHIAGLDKSWKLDDLKKEFQNYSDIILPMKRNKTELNLGYAFLFYKTEDDAKKALESLENKEIKGIKIRVGYAYVLSSEPTKPPLKPETTNTKMEVSDANGEDKNKKEVAANGKNKKVAEKKDNKNAKKENAKEKKNDTKNNKRKLEEEDDDEDEDEDDDEDEDEDDDEDDEDDDDEEEEEEEKKPKKANKK